jgi:hypothetical protein
VSLRRIFFGGRRSGRNAPGQQGGRAGKEAAASGALDPEGWQVGDLAECVASGTWFDHRGQPVPGPKPGQVLKVVAVSTGWTLGEPGVVLGLSFAAWPGNAWVARAFRKVRPRADDTTPAEAEFTELVRRRRTPALGPETIEVHQ